MAQAHFLPMFAAPAAGATIATPKRFSHDPYSYQAFSPVSVPQAPRGVEGSQQFEDRFQASECERVNHPGLPSSGSDEGATPLAKQQQLPQQPAMLCPVTLQEAAGSYPASVAASSHRTSANASSRSSIASLNTPLEEAMCSVAVTGSPRSSVVSAAAAAPMPGRAVMQCMAQGITFKFATVAFRFHNQTYVAPFKLLPGETVIVEHDDETEHMGVVTGIRAALDEGESLPTFRVLRRARDEERRAFAGLKGTDQQWCKVAREALRKAVTIRFEFRGVEVHPQEQGLTFLMSFDNHHEAVAFQATVASTLRAELGRPVTVLLSPLLMRPRKGYRPVVSAAGAAFDELSLADDDHSDASTKCDSNP